MVIGAKEWQMEKIEFVFTIARHGARTPFQGSFDELIDLEAFPVGKEILTP